VSDDPASRPRFLHPWLFVLLLAVLIGAAVLRSSLATRLDSFTFDESYHIGAGAAYVQTGDFRLNPEHPPLVKLWIGAFLPDFKRSPYRPLRDKIDERQFTENDVYLRNDPDVLQGRTRTAMFLLNGLLLAFFAFAVRRVFGDGMALAAVAWLAIDPTVAAHLPVVMTDLPVALLSATAVLLAVAAFCSWRPLDLTLAAVALGLALSSKHSAVVALAAVAGIGLVMALSGSPRLRRTLAVVAVLAGAVIVLWGTYLFRYRESPGKSEEQFNRPLALKISDVQSPLYRAGLTVMDRGRLFPRPYTWGMADTIRAGAEGRAISVLAFGRVYYSRAPWYFFPGNLAVKVPLGLLVLSLTGAGLLAVRRGPWGAPWIGVGFLALLFLLALGTGSSYAGVRHALPLVPPLALLGAVAVVEAARSRSRFLRGVAAVALAGALLSALPVLRPWEYFNELAGGTENGYRYFNDEGVDLSLRTKEIVAYYDKNLKPRGEVPYVLYFAPQLEWRRRGLDWVGKDLERDVPRIFSDKLNGTFLVSANALGPTLWWDLGKIFRGAAPVGRFGNVFVYRGTFPGSREAQARVLYTHARRLLSGAEPDLQGGIERLSQSVALDPTAFFASIELGNQLLKTGNREEALRAYRLAGEHAPADDLREMITGQIERLQAGPLDRIPPLRNPGFE
jgi:hypothetical protein